MTNGVIVALGDVGRNVAAGMSGGILYLYEAGHPGEPRNNGNAMKCVGWIEILKSFKAHMFGGKKRQYHHHMYIYILFIVSLY